MRCAGKVKSTGQRCKKQAEGNTTFCMWHDPERRDEALEIQRAGAAANRKVLMKLPPMTDAKSAQEITSVVTLAVAQGQIDKTRAQVVLQGVKLFMDATLKLRYEEQINDIQQRIKALQGPAIRIPQVGDSPLEAEAFPPEPGVE